MSLSCWGKLKMGKHKVGPSGWKTWRFSLKGSNNLTLEIIEVVKLEFFLTKVVISKTFNNEGSFYLKVLVEHWKRFPFSTTSLHSTPLYINHKIWIFFITFPNSNTKQNGLIPTTIITPFTSTFFTILLSSRLCHSASSPYLIPILKDSSKPQYITSFLLGTSSFRVYLYIDLSNPWS